MISPDTRTVVPPGISARPRLGVVFAVVAAGVAMSNLDVFIVNVALPRIGEHFADASLSSLSWVLNAYAVVFAALLVPAGNLADRTGPRRAYLVGGIGWWAWRLTPDAGYAQGMLPGMLLTGVGVGLTLPTLIGAAVTALPPRSFSTGSGVVTMARQIGTVLGVAMLVAALGVPRGTAEALDAFDAGWYLTLLATAAAAVACLCVRRRSGGENS
ncbi:MFS transporter [Streptosporangium amethystogenes]|uniref:MFS transporter n=1 Tax=Streptosporangium amethystogenes TaxID=2002 RepID=UPI0004C512E3|nr:MFS transporter [Streptosporangium amethystogenes]